GAERTGQGGAGKPAVIVGGASEAFSFPAELLGKLNGSSAKKLSLGIRPEGVIIAREAAEGFLPAEAHIIEPLGSYDIVDLKFGEQMMRARTRSGFVAKAGDRVFARLDPTQTHFFDTQSGQSLGIRL